MSLPRKILPQTTYLLTRRTILRHMLLRPDPIMNEILVYLLAFYADRTGLQIHAFCAMSTHMHLVVTDVKGNLPEFLQAFHLLVARCTQAHRQWDDSIWDTSQTSVVQLETEAAVIEKIAYVIANPVTAGLVRRAHEWPGAKTSVDDIGRGKLTARRPNVYLNPKNRQWPAEAAIPISPPPGIEPEKAPSFREQVTTEVERLEAAAHAAMQARGRRFLGADRARTVSPTSRATTVEPRIARNPTFAVGRNHGEARARAAAAIQAFRASYRAALDRWRAGARSTVFPAGTWLMRVFHHAAVADPAMAA